VLVDHGDAFDEWRLATTDGDTVSGSSCGSRLGSPLGPFVTEVTVDDGSTATPTEIALHLTLTSFVVAGGLRAAIEAATAHVVGRVQFDKPLSAFQAVQFQLADAHVAACGVDEMAQFALWRCHAEPGRSIVDALGARVAALDAARSVLRTTQQLHGAAGVCDEYDVSVIARHLQPALRLPFGAEASAEQLADFIERFGFAGLFEHQAPSR
jgi:alkylation response protein AidB-like acyl-CoA dehydrogenase